jgi:DNA-binding CsgD family transcriptional regulator
VSVPAFATHDSDRDHARTGISGPAFVGRERELATLRQALTWPSTIALVEGEAGVGKSRLVHELLATTPGPERTPVAVCPPYLESLTLGPIVDALRQATDDVRGLNLSPLAGALRPVFPEWADELPPSPEPLEDAAAARHRLFRAFAELLDRLRVGLLVVEDVHWADDVTLEFLLFLASRLPKAPSLLITYRPDEVLAGSPLLRLSSRLPAGTTQVRLPLDGLDVEATARLVSSMLEGRPLSAAFASFLHQHTDGIPLAVEEVVRLMHERADLARQDGEWVRRRLDNIHVPPTIRDAVLERAGRLPPDGQEVLRASAVLADATDEATLTAVSGLPADRVRAGLAAALETRLLQENERGELGFRHLLNRRAIYEAIPAPQRRAMHGRAGRAMENKTPVPLTRLVRHFREAGETDLWCRYAEQAVDLALASGNEVSACTLLHDLVVQADLPPATVVRLVEKIPYATLTGLDRFRGLVTSLRSVLDSGTLRPAEEGEIRFVLGRMLSMMEDHESGRVELERSIPLLGHKPLMAARAMLTLGWPRGTATAEQHQEWLRRANELTPLMPPADRLRAIVDRTSALLLLGDEAGWTEAARIPEAESGLVHERWEIIRGLVNVADAAVLWGRYRDAERRLAFALRFVAHHHYVRPREFILATQARLNYHTGAWTGLAERAESLAASEHLLPVSRLEPVLVVGLLRAAGGAGQEAEERLRTVLERSTAYNALERIAEPAAALARLLLADGRVSDALAVSEEVIGVVAHKQIWLWATELGPVRVEALVTAGRLDDAAQLVAAFDRGLRGRNIPAAAAGLATCRALLLSGQGDPAAAAGFARAAEAWDRLPRPYAALLSRERQATCLVSAGRTESGLALLSEVFAGLADLGARGDALRVMRALREHGVEVKRPWWGGRRGYGDDLSPRELDVARLVADGRTNREIAEKLFLSPKTVAAHLNSAMRKLNVPSRTALAVRLMEADKE